MRVVFILVSTILLSEAKDKRYENENRPIDDMTKQHLDLLELYRKYGKIPSENIMEKKQAGHNERSRGSAGPEYHSNYNPYNVLKETKTDATKRKKGTKKDDTLWLDFTGNYFRNMERNQQKIPMPNTRKISNNANNPNRTPPDNLDYINRVQFSPQNVFDSEYFRRQRVIYNWTTCDEFGHNSEFHPNHVVDIEWVPFYTWTENGIQRPVANIHKFTFPTIKLVQKYKSEMGPYLNKSVDWEEPTLFLKSDLSMLLVAVDRKGEFYGIPYANVPSSMKNTKLTLPMIHLRLKIVGQYLAMMFCNRQYATIMAESGSEPNTINKIRSEAAKLKFKGRGYPVARDLELERMSKLIEVDPDFLF